MDEMGSEVSDKIRSAIKAKLMELGAYVDEELPDYIMIMVANKRSRAQMKGDLQLFLGSNTDVFTTWLHQVLQKLEEVTIASQERKRKSSAGETESTNNKKDKKKKTVDKKKDQAKSKDTKVESATVTAVTAEDKAITKKQSTVDEEGTKKSLGPTNDDKKTRRLSSDSQKEPTIGVANKEKGQEKNAAEVKSSKTKHKVVLMQSDEDDDDFINIKADAEAEALLDAELPKEVPEKNDANNIKRSTVTITTKPAQPLVRPVKAVVEAQKVLPMSTTAEKSGAGDSQGDKTISSSVTERLPLRRVISLRPEAKAQAAKDTEQNNSMTSRLGGRLGVRKNVSVAQVAPTRTINITKTVKLDGKEQDCVSPLKRISETTADQSQRKRPLLSRVVALRKDLPTNKQKEDEEYDPANPAVGSLASVVRVKPRPKIPAALQANKNLILKAVAEAHKSVANAPKRVDPTERPDGIFTKRFRDKQNQISIALTNSSIKPREQQQINEKPLDIERIVIPVKLDSSRSISSVNLQQKIVIQVSAKKSSESTESPEPDSTNFLPLEADEYSEQELMEYEETPLKPLECVSPEEVKEDDLDNLMDYEPESTWDKELEKRFEPSSATAPARVSIDSSPAMMQRTESPQFVVTLDGLDPALFQGTKKPLVTSTTQKETKKTEIKRSVSPIVFTPTSTTTSTATGTSADTPKQKIIERCKYWPACRSGDKCDYLHPTAPCKSFPNCKFGDKCLYIHPNCKFDASCTRRDCPFTHAIPRNLKNATSRTPSTSAAPVKAVQVCKYFPRCSNTSCRFLHPKPCRYGRYCSKKKECTFLHDEIPPAEKLKWFCPFRL